MFFGNLKFTCRSLHKKSLNFLSALFYRLNRFLQLMHIDAHRTIDPFLGRKQHNKLFLFFMALSSTLLLALIQKRGVHHDCIVLYDKPL